MKYLLTLFLFVLALPSFAADPNHYVYSVRVPAGKTDCATAAQQFAARFQAATGIAAVQSASCRAATDIVMDKAHYQVYSLALTYFADWAYQPYSVFIGKADLYADPIKDQTVYETYASCLADIDQQVSNYQQQTGLTAVAAECVVENNASLHVAYALHIDGFDKKASPDHMKSLYSFVPSQLSDLDASRTAQIVSYLHAQGAEIVKQGKITFVYYSDHAAGLSSVRVASLHTAYECSSQIDQVRSMLSTKGSKSPLIWCVPQSQAQAVTTTDLEVVYDGYFYLNNNFGLSSTKYYSFAECINDRELVLSDSRNLDKIGGICAPSSYVDDAYELILFSNN